jgi:hypothetical protein
MRRADSTLQRLLDTCDESATIDALVSITRSTGRNLCSRLGMALIGEVKMNAQHARFPVTQGNECYARPWEVYNRRLATAPAPILGGRNYTKVYKERLKTNACPWPYTLTFPPLPFVQIYHNWLPFDFDAFLRDPVAVELGAAPMVRVKMNALHVRSSVSQGNECYARP